MGREIFGCVQKESDSILSNGELLGMLLRILTDVLRSGKPGNMGLFEGSGIPEPSHSGLEHALREILQAGTVDPKILDDLQSKGLVDDQAKVTPKLQNLIQTRYNKIRSVNQ